MEHYKDEIIRTKKISAVLGICIILLLIAAITCLCAEITTGKF